jgi:transposase
MTRQGRSPQELRERAVRMVFEHQDEHPSQWAAICSITAKFSISHETLGNGVRRAETDGGLRPGLTSEERERLKTLEREVRELRRANAILKSAAVFFGAELDRRDDRLHRRPQGPVRGRADLPGVADRPRPPMTPPAATRLRARCARRQAQERDRPGPCRAVRRLRCPQGLAAARAGPSGGSRAGGRGGRAAVARL